MSNNLNQYTSIQEASDAAFTPQFDADGNQILIKTSTGIWSAVYNAENRPVTFTNSESNTVVECAYDSMGRRAYKKVTVNGEVTLHQRYIYRGYLQIACIDLTRTAHPALWYITWDPTQPVATRPLSIQINGTWHTYGWDLTKNICELYSTSGTISTSYTYAPFGLPSQSTNGAAAGLLQPIQWSSEVWDAELGLVYYNWRYYDVYSGRWGSRDRIDENHNISPYLYALNSCVYMTDIIGNMLRYATLEDDVHVMERYCDIKFENNTRILGETETLWPTIGTCLSDGYLMLPEEHVIAIIIHIYNFKGYENWRDLEGNTPREHEYKHAKSYIQYWNSFVLNVQSRNYEKKYESRSRCESIRTTLNNILTKISEMAKKKQLSFDAAVYPRR